MKKYTYAFFPTLTLILLILWVNSTRVDNKSIYEKFIKINKGDCYIMSFKSENPFKEYAADTVLITNKKNKYIEYKKTMDMYQVKK